CMKDYNRYYFIFFQAEDGIRDDLVTGVQTCALPISRKRRGPPVSYSRRNMARWYGFYNQPGEEAAAKSRISGSWPVARMKARRSDRKSTRLNSSHQMSSYDVFCVKKKTKNSAIQSCH